jgi:hypothetical protein
MPRPEVPVGATGEVARVLGAATHYEVLEVPHDAGALAAWSTCASSSLLSRTAALTGIHRAAASARHLTLLTSAVVPM